MTTHTRRDFLTLAASAAAALPLRSLAQVGAERIGGTLTVNPAVPGPTLPADFTGLSYESAQLANPAFFSARNTALVGLFRELTPHGVLRIGGGSSEFTTYSATALSAPPPFETFGPDTSKTTKSGTITTALALQNLRAFLDATDWTCLYGLNLGQGKRENAVSEAEAVHRILGPRLLAFQIGNEPDSFRNRYRPASYTPEDFVREWLDFHASIAARVPDAKFAGPDISNKLSYLTAFAAIAAQYPDIAFLSGHYYAMGPAGNPAATLDNMLAPNPALTTLKWAAVPTIQDAIRVAKLPFRITEANSCWNGGQPGASDVFGSALWCADTMLHFASLGFCGVNLHGGGNGIYSPIIGAPSTGFTKRPEYFGIQFAQHFAGATLLSATLDCDEPRITAYAARTPLGNRLIAIINKTNTPAEVSLTDPSTVSPHWRATVLTAATLDAKSAQFRYAPLRLNRRVPISIDAHSAMLLSNG